MEDELEKKGSPKTAIFEEREFMSDPGQEEIRIDKYLLDKMAGVSRNRIQNAIKDGLVLINDKNVKPNFKLKGQQKVFLKIPRNHIGGDAVVPEEMPLNVVYEDDQVLVINKPVGLVVHPGVGNYSGTLVNGLAHYLNRSDLPIKEGNSIDRPGIVHRIDKNTSGLMVIAKTPEAMTHLGNQFLEHSVTREYYALIWGSFDEQKGTIEGNIGRNPKNRMQMWVFPDNEDGKHAVTHYEVVEDLYYVSVVKCVLETGRTHQIRVHMQYSGHPIFNDERYGGDKVRKGTVFNKYKQFVHNCFKIMPGHVLHAKTLGFEHPVTGERMVFSSELPEAYEDLLGKWRHYLDHRKSIV